MKKYVFMMLAVLLSGVVSAQNGGKRMKNYESQFSVDETMQRIEQKLSVLEIPVFARFDHRKNAEEAGLELRPNKVIVFGSPKVGTKLMQANPAISIELPLKISVWEDKNGKVWATIPQMNRLAIEYGLQTEAVVSKLQSLLEKIAAEATQENKEEGIRKK